MEDTNVIPIEPYLRPTNKPLHVRCVVLQFRRPFELGDSARFQGPPRLTPEQAEAVHSFQSSYDLTLTTLLRDCTYEQAVEILTRKEEQVYARVGLDKNGEPPWERR